MGQFKLICIDMFQTLVDVNTRTYYIWKRILKDNYSEHLKEQCIKLATTKVVNHFHNQVSGQDTFFNLKTLFEPCFVEISKEIGINFNPKVAVEIFLDEHGNATPYTDALEFFRLLGNSIPVCLVSDADNEMI